MIRTEAREPRNKQLTRKERGHQHPQCLSAVTPRDLREAAIEGFEQRLDFIQQRVTGNLFVTFSTNVATTQEQIIQGQYQVSPRVAISATGYGNGGFGVDALIKKNW